MTLKRTVLFQPQKLAWIALLLAPAALGAKGCEVAVIGSECGGLAGAQCGSDQYCDFAPDAACGAADRTGTCAAIPEVCTAISDPVCGCDDETYGNACSAHAAGVSVATEGECAPEDGPADRICGGLLGASCAVGEFCSFALDALCGSADQTGTCEPTPEVCTDIYAPVCGCDDKTYGNACAANAARVSVASEGECAPPDAGGAGKICGGLLGASCAAGEFCSFALDALCGSADQTGTCEPTPEVCTDIFAPVCGCDGETYGNGCAANAVGVSVASQGECAPADGGDGTTCGGLLGAQCADGEFCNFAPEALCGAADQTGTCEPRPEACTLQYDPVCACDDQTYSNACAAHSAGFSVVREGECASPGGAICGGLLGAQCADAEFCNFALEASCGAADQTGTCEAIPGACTLELNPVCGCDDTTYGNACAAHAAGVSVVATGACP